MCNIELLGYCIVTDNCPPECIREHEEKEIETLINQEYQEREV